MTKRAALIITDEKVIKWLGWNEPVFMTRSTKPSEQLLADLQASVTACDFVADELERASAGRSENVMVWRDRAARVRALLPKGEGEDG